MHETRARHVILRSKSVHDSNSHVVALYYNNVSLQDYCIDVIMLSRTLGMKYTKSATLADNAGDPKV